MIPPVAQIIELGRPCDCRPRCVTRRTCPLSLAGRHADRPGLPPLVRVDWNRKTRRWDLVCLSYVREDG